MKTRILAIALAFPLVAFDCGGKEEAPALPGSGCTLRIRGAATEDLWCIVAAYDYSAMDPTDTMWSFELVAYRGMTEVGAGVGIFHDGRPALATPYGWTGTSSSVESGSASRTIGDAVSGTPTTTHEAMALAGSGTGTLSVTFTSVPAAGATGPELMDVHGTLAATVPSVDAGGAPVTFDATF